MKFDDDAAAGAVVALAVVALVVGFVLAAKKVHRRQRARRAEGAVELLVPPVPSCPGPGAPEPEPTPPASDAVPIGIHIGDASTGQIVTGAKVWPKEEPSWGVIKTHETFDIMKTLFILHGSSPASKEDRGNLFCILNGIKKHHAHIVSMDKDIEEGCIIWIWTKPAWMEEHARVSRVPG